MSYKEFRKDLRSSMFNNVVMLTGKENFLVHWAVNQLKKKYGGKEFQAQNVHEFDGAQADIDEVIGMARTPSMFPGHRVLIVRNYPWLFQKKGKEELKEFQEGAGARLLEYAAGADHSEYASMIIMTVDAQYYKDSSPRNCGLTAYGKKLLQKSSGYEMNTLNRAELEGFIGKRVKAAGKQMTRNQLNYLIDLSGYYNEETVYRLDDLENDLHKILYSTEGEQITNEEIEDLMAGDADKFVFHLIDALMSGNRKTAITLTEHILYEDPKASFQVIGLLISQFEMMYDAHLAIEKGVDLKRMAKEIGVNEYRFKKAYGAAKKFRKNRIRDLLIQLYNADRDIKRGNLSDRAALEAFILHV